MDDVVAGRRSDHPAEDLAVVPFGFAMLLADLERARKRWRAAGSPLVGAWVWIGEEIRTRTHRVGPWLDTTALT